MSSNRHDVAFDAGRPALRPRHALPGTTSQSQEVRRAGFEDLDRLVGLLVATTAPTGLGHFLVPDHRQRAVQLRRYFRIIVPAALACGGVYVATGFQAAAFWLPITASGEPKIPAYLSRVTSMLDARFLVRVLELDAARARQRPSERHFWLAYLAAHESPRGHELAGQVLRAHHPVLDQLGVPGYAEALGDAGAELLTAHDYQPVDKFTLGATGPTITRLCRTAAPKPAQGAVRVPLQRPYLF